MIVKIFGSLFYIISFLLLLGDSFGYPASSLKYFFIDSRFIYLLFILTQIIFCFLSAKLLPEKFVKLNNTLIFPLVSASFIFFALLNGFTYQFYVFNNFSINLENFKYLFFISGFVLMANVSASWLKTFPQKLLYFAGVIYLVAFSFASVFLPEIVRAIIKEDGLLENIQVTLYITAFFVSLACIYYSLRLPQKLITVFFILLSLGLFFISGEEISWGQRIFNLPTPEPIASISRQDEMTIHNIKYVQAELDYLYMLVGIWGSLSYIFFQKFFPGLFKKFKVTFPPPILFFYFFAVTRYYFLNKFVVFNYQLFSFEKIGIGDRQEISETLLATGFACFAIYALVSLKKSRQKA